MKHSVAKTDKKGKREMSAEIAKLEAELENRHENELEQFRRSKVKKTAVSFNSFLRFYSKFCRKTTKTTKMASN